MSLSVVRIRSICVLLASLAAAVSATAAPPPPPAQAAPAQAHVETLTLAVGSHKLLRLPAPIARVAIGEPKVADINLVGSKELLVLAKGQGVTSLLVWPRATRKQKNVEPQEYRISVGNFGAEADADLGAVSIQPGSGLEGRVDTLLAHRRAELSALPSDKAGVVDRTLINVDSQVMTEIKIVEVTKTTAQRYGLNIFGYTNGGANPFGAGAFPRGSLGTASLNTGSNAVSITQKIPISDAFNFVFGNRYFLSVLSVLENKNLARTLAEPSLTAMSGQTATFLAGGEFPIPVPQSSGGGSNSSTVTIQYKEFGVRLNLTPTVLSTSRIALKVAPEVSELDYTNGVNLDGFVIPGLIVRRTDTTVELGDGETFVVSGLVSNNMKANVDKVPLLGDLPVIGAFFKSNSYQRDDKELIMVVTPHLVRPLRRDAQLPALPGASIDGYRPTFTQTMMLENGEFGQSDNGYSR